MMTNSELWPLMVGVVMPIIVALVVQTQWGSCAKSIVAVLICSLGGYGTAYFTGQLDGKDVARDIMLVIIATKTFYSAFWKPTGICDVIENATTIGGK